MIWWIPSLVFFFVSDFINVWTLDNSILLFRPDWPRLESASYAKERSSHRKFSAKKRSSYKFHKFHRKAPVLGSLFNDNFTKNRLQQRRFPMKFEKFLRSPILKIICERLLLKIEIVLPQFAFFGYSTVKKLKDTLKVYF